MATPSRNGTAGFTLLELLVTVALASFIVTFAIGALQYTNRIWNLSRDAEADNRIQAARARVTNLLSETRAGLVADQALGRAVMVFEGDSDHVTFLTLSEGHASYGGIMFATLSFEKGSVPGAMGSLSLQSSIFRPNGTKQNLPEPTILLADVKALRFSYFGGDTPDSADAWSGEWRNRNRLPKYIRLEIEVAPANIQRKIEIIVPIQ